MFLSRYWILALRLRHLSVRLSTSSCNSKSGMSLPHKSIRRGTRGYAHLIEVDVPVARVWRALTDPGLIRIWAGKEAEIYPPQGGVERPGGGHETFREAHL